MAIPDFVPIIGRDFSDVGQQLYNWAGFSKSVEEGNIQRETQAERDQANWLAQMEKQNQETQNINIDRQLGAEAQARALALQRQQEATRQSERTQDIANQKTQFGQQMQFGKDQLTQQAKIAEAKITAAEKNKDLITESHGQTLAANYGVTKKNAEAAQAALKDLQDAQDKDEAALEATDLKKEPQKFQLLKTKITARKGDIRAAETAARMTSNKLDKLETTAGNAGFEIQDDGSIVHSETGKKWSWKNALKEAQTSTGNSASDLSSVLARPGGDNVLPPEMAGTQTGTFTGFPQPTADAGPTAPVAPTQAQSPFPDGTVIRSKKDGNLYRVQNGAPVMIPPEEQP